jgi:hypothetical protein
LEIEVVVFACEISPILSLIDDLVNCVLHIQEVHFRNLVWCTSSEYSTKRLHALADRRARGRRNTDIHLGYIQALDQSPNRHQDAHVARSEALESDAAGGVS